MHYCLTGLVPAASCVTPLQRTHPSRNSCPRSRMDLQ